MGGHLPEGNYRWHTIGPHCLIFQQVTIGTGGSKPGVPAPGGHVGIGLGTKILGGENRKPRSYRGERRGPSGRTARSGRCWRPGKDFKWKAAGLKDECVSNSFLESSFPHPFENSGL
jgi:hypothetical protein